MSCIIILLYSADIVYAAYYSVYINTCNAAMFGNQHNYYVCIDTLCRSNMLIYFPVMHACLIYHRISKSW